MAYSLAKLCWSMAISLTGAVREQIVNVVKSYWEIGGVCAWGHDFLQCMQSNYKAVSSITI